MRCATPKRAAAVRVYLRRSRLFLEANPQCARCGGIADQVHHKAGRDGYRLLDESRWLSLCGPCHCHITTHPLEAIRQGFSLPRIGVTDEEEAATDQGAEPDWLPGGAA